MAIDLTKGTDCVNIVVESDLIATYNATPAQYTFTVSVVINCCSSTYSQDIAIDDANLDVDAETYTLVPAFFSLTGTSLPDGVYLVTIRLTDTDTGSYDEWKQCIYIDCNTKCRVFNFSRDNANWFNVFTTYLALTYAQDCDDCDCGSSCTLYDRLCSYLNIPIQDSDCNCGC